MTFLFYLFSALALFGGIGVVVNRNPVSSAISMIISFLGLAALFIQLDAFLVGILQILVYAGAIMVLFLFIIGVKRTFRMEEVQEPSRPEDPEASSGARTQPPRSREPSPGRARRAGD